MSASITKAKSIATLFIQIPNFGLQIFYIQLILRALNLSSFLLFSYASHHARLTMGRSQTSSAMELLFQRRANLSKPNNRQDPFNLALILEGGGMRSCVTTGMCAALSRMRYINCFDQVVATSAGAMQAPYLLSNQLLASAPSYATDIAKRRFINTWRACDSYRPIMDLDYLLDHVMKERHPLDFEKMRRVGIPLHVVTTNCSNGELVALSDFQNQEELHTALRASAFIPGVGGTEAIPFRGKHLIDGGFSALLPEDVARLNGATHLLVLTNLPAGQFHDEPTSNHKRIVGGALANLSSPVARSFLLDHARDNEQLARIRSGSDPTIAHCEMQNGPRINTLCIKRNTIWEGLETGFTTMCDFLWQPQRQLPKQWRSLKKK